MLGFLKKRSANWAALLLLIVPVILSVKVYDVDYHTIVGRNLGVDSILGHLDKTVTFLAKKMIDGDGDGVGRPSSLFHAAEEWGEDEEEEEYEHIEDEEEEEEWNEDEEEEEAYFEEEEEEEINYNEELEEAYAEEEWDYSLLFPEDEECFKNTGELCTTADFREAFNCYEVLSKPRPIHDEPTWMLLRSAYTDAVGKEDSSIQYPITAQSGYQVEIEVKQTPGAGRGVYAAQDIAKGTRIWTNRVQSARFITGSSYRRFLSALGNDLICDLLIWCYPTFLDEEDPKSVRIACDLDEGSFVNDAEEYGAHNFGCDEEAVEEYAHEGGCRDNFFAMTDIKKGEELRAWYGQFASGDQWERFGLEREK